MATLIVVSNLTSTATPIIDNGLNGSSVEPGTVIEIKEPTNKDIIATLARRQGVNPDLALAISQCESEHRQFNQDGTVLRGRQNPQDVGLFQINEFYHLEDSKKLGYDIYTAKGNVEYAFHIMKRDGVRHWTYSKPCWGHKVASHQVALAK